MTLNGIDLLIIFTWGILVTFALSWVCDALIGKFVISKLPPEAAAAMAGPATAEMSESISPAEAQEPGNDREIH